MLGFRLNKLGAAIRNFRITDLFTPDTEGSYYDLNSIEATPDGYHSTAGQYEVLDDGRGQVNLFTQSSAIGETAWTKTRTTVPTTNRANPLTGKNNGCKLVETADTGAHYFYAASGFYTFESGADYIMEVWVEAAERDEFDVVLPGGAFGVNKEVTFNLTDETTSTADTGITYGLEDEGGGMWRAWVQGTATSTASANTVVLQLHDENGDFSYTGDITKGIYVYGASLRKASTIGPYQETNDTTHGPGQPVGILLPGNRDGRGVVNKAPNSPYPLAADWSETESTFTTVAVTGPDGDSILATKIFSTTNAAVHFALLNNSVTGGGYVSGTRYVNKIQVKAAGYNFVQLNFPNTQFPDGTGGNGRKCCFSLVDGSTTTPGTGLNVAANAIGNDWWEVEISQEADATSTAEYMIGIVVAQTLVIESSYAGDGTSGIYVRRVEHRVGDVEDGVAYQETGPYLGGPGEHFGQATSPNRMTLGRYPRGGLLAGSATWAGFFAGTSGNYFSTPDSAALDITGDIEIQCHAALTDWTSGSEQFLVGKYLGTGNQRSYALYVDSTGHLAFRLSVDGTGTVTNYISSVVIPATDGDPIFLKSELDADDGASGSICTLYTSTDGENWTQLGTPQTAANKTIYAGTALLEIGSISGGTAGLCTGKIYRAIVKNGIGGTVVADFNPLDYGGSGNTWTSSGAGGETWTRNGSAFLGSDDLVRTNAYDYDIPGVPSLTTLYGDGVSDYLSLGKQYLTPVQDDRGVVNLLYFSERFTNTSYYSVNNASISANVTTTWDGESTASKLIEDTSANRHYIQYSMGSNLTNGVTYTFSIEVKAAGRTYVEARFGRGSNKTLFNLTTQGTTDTGTVTSSIESLGDDWYRIRVSSPVENSGGQLNYCYIEIYNDSGSAPYTGDGSSGIYIQRWQCELGSSLTAYQANSYTLGGSLGTAGLFCEPTQQWAVGGAFATFAVNGTIFAKSAASNGTLQLLTSSLTTGVRVIVRGTAQNVETITAADGLVHCWLLVWDGSTLKLYLDNEAATTLTVGAVAENTDDISWSARTPSSPALWFKGHNNPEVLLGYAPNAAQCGQIMSYLNNKYGV